MTGSIAAPDWFTDALASAPRVDYATVFNTRICYRSWGESHTGTPDLLLVHGGAAHAHWWDHLAPQLAEDRRVVALDLSGHGDSDHCPFYSFDTWADELAAVIAATDINALAGPAASQGENHEPPRSDLLGPREPAKGSRSGRPPIVVGHSLGGLVTVVLANRGSPALSGAIIVDSPIEPSGPPPRPNEDPISFGNARVYATANEAMARFRPVPAQPALDYITDHIAGTSLHQVSGGWGWKFDPAFAAMHGYTPRTLSGVPCPVAMIAAQHGILSADARNALAESADVTFIEIPDAGHAIMLDQPLELLQTIRRLLTAWQ